tara:strand:+ start:283 stop:1263 length:981 start_codon:yes stop_codon:yes gene_type:complete
MLKFSKILLFSIIAVWSVVLNAKTTTATSSGNWNNGGTWDNGVPACGDNVYINQGITVTVTASVDLDEPACTSPMYVEINGILKFNTGRKMYLACGSVVFVSSTGQLQKGGGGGNSNLIEECGSTIWRAGDGNISGPQYVGSGLPIELKSFEAVPNGNNVHLSWTTASEINNDYFTIQRLSEGQLIQDIEYIQGAGNSSRELNYKTTDSDPPSGTVYYRLKQTDFDGGSSQSAWVAVNPTSAKGQIKLITNVSNESFSLEVNGFDNEQASIDLFTIEGRQLYSERVFINSEYFNHKITASGRIISGTYLLRVMLADHVESFKVVVP